MILKETKYAKVFNELLPIAIKMDKEITINNFFKFCDITIYANCQSIFREIMDTANKLRKKEKKQTTNKQRKLYLKLCDELDLIIDKSGIKKECIKCYTTKLYKHAEAPNYINGGSKKKTYGCCKDCKYLGKDGCTTKSITCKLWLCSDRLVAKIILAGYYHRWIEIVQTCNDNGWSFHLRGPFYRFVRMGVDDYPELREVDVDTPMIEGDAGTPVIDGEKQLCGLSTLKFSKETGRYE